MQLESVGSLLKGEHMKHAALLLLMFSLFLFTPAFAQDTDSDQEAYVAVGETYEVRLAKNRDDKFVKWVHIEDNFKTNHFVGSVSISYIKDKKRIIIKCVGCDAADDFVKWDGNYKVTPDEDREFTGRQPFYEYTTKEGLNFKITRHSLLRYTVLINGRIKQFKSWKDE
jgi:hypothetical protein